MVAAVPREFTSYSLHSQLSNTYNRSETPALETGFQTAESCAFQVAKKSSSVKMKNLKFFHSQGKYSGRNRVW